MSVRIQALEIHYRCAGSIRIYNFTVTALTAIRNRRIETSDHGVSTINYTTENKSG